MEGSLLVDIEQNQIVDRICAICHPLMLVIVDMRSSGISIMEVALEVLSILDHLEPRENLLCRLQPEPGQQDVGHVDSMNMRFIQSVDPFLDIPVHHSGFVIPTVIIVQIQSLIPSVHPEQLGWEQRGIRRLQKIIRQRFDVLMEFIVPEMVAHHQHLPVRVDIWLKTILPFQIRVPDKVSRQQHVGDEM